MHVHSYRKMELQRNRPKCYWPSIGTWNPVDQFWSFFEIKKKKNLKLLRIDKFKRKKLKNYFVAFIYFTIPLLPHLIKPMTTSYSNQELRKMIAFFLFVPRALYAVRLNLTTPLLNRTFMPLETLAARPSSSGSRDSKKEHCSKIYDKSILDTYLIKEKEAHPSFHTTCEEIGLHTPSLPRAELTPNLRPMFTSTFTLISFGLPGV